MLKCILNKKCRFLKTIQNVHAGMFESRRNYEGNTNIAKASNTF